jgi:hypothetical protein
MKTNLTLFCFLICVSLNTLAQWTSDPENPQLVSNTTCIQFDVQSVSDGNGGAYLFWKDSRTTGCNSGPDYDIFGQHYNAEGIAQWEENGREIWANHSHITQFQVVRDEESGEMVIGSHSVIDSFYDSLWVQQLNPDGSLGWEDDLLIASGDQCGLPTYTLGVGSFRMMKDDSGYVVSLEMVYCGGANGNRITRFDINGNLTGPYNGSPEGTQYYFGSPGIDRTYDSSNDIYLFYSNGNGMGAHASCMRVGLAGDSAWAPIDVLEGTNGLNYGFQGKSDQDGIAFLFASNGDNGTNADLFMRKLNPDGSWAWNGNTTVICQAENIQSNFDWVQDENYYYACWADGRPGIIGNYGLFAQKIDKVTGATLWGENGLQILDQSTYIPYPKLQLLNDGNLLFINESTAAEYGFNAILCDTDGSPLWDDPIAMAVPFLSPFYEDYQIIKSDENIIIAWSKDDGVYIANPFVALITQISETVSSCDSYELNGTTYTESGIYTIELPGDTILTLDLTINTVDANITLTDITLSTTNIGTLWWINCDDNSILVDDTNVFTPSVSGNYALTVTENDCTDTSECVYVEVVGVEEQASSLFEIFPNPFSDQFYFTNKGSFVTQEIRIVDISGNLVHAEYLKNDSGSIQPNLANGVYYLTFITANSSSTIRIIKCD